MTRSYNGTSEVPNRHRAPNIRTPKANIRTSKNSVTDISAPLILDTPDSIPWDQSCDVLVVGWGAAGACAALQARAKGSDVMVIDRFQGGGASAKSGGVVYAGGGTEQQLQAGLQDSPEAMYDYLRHETQGVIEDKTLWRFCRDSKDNLKWLQSHGVPFNHKMPPGGKTSYPQDGYYLYYSGNEQVPAYRGEQPPAARGHRTLGKGHGGAVLYHHLKNACQQQGVRSLNQCAVRRLITAPGLGVVGVEAWAMPPNSRVSQQHARWAKRAEKLQNIAPGYSNRLRLKVAGLEQEYARRICIRARQGVILSTGGFIFNRQLMAQHAETYKRNFKIGATGCDGSGLRLGQSVQAATERLNTVSAWRFINPPQSWPKGIAVNGDGQRFCNEEVYGATLGHAICEHQDGKAWLILDKPLRQQAIRQCLFGGYWWFQSVPALAMMLLSAKKAHTLDKLAAKTGMQPDQLHRSVQAYNHAIQHQLADPQGKSADSCQLLDKAPYYALDISVRSALLPLGALTLGGLKVNEDSGQVLDESQQPIPGLYAAGRAAVGIPSNLYISGLSLADCVFSGRRAGNACALSDSRHEAAPRRKAHNTNSAVL